MLFESRYSCLVLLWCKYSAGETKSGWSCLTVHLSDLSGLASTVSERSDLTFGNILPDSSCRHSWYLDSRSVNKPLLTSGSTRFAAPACRAVFLPTAEKHFIVGLKFHHTVWTHSSASTIPVSASEWPLVCSPPHNFSICRKSCTYI